MSVLYFYICVQRKERKIEKKNWRKTWDQWKN